MSTAPRSGATAPGAGTHSHAHDRGRTLAQWYATLVGATLILVGLLGFLVDSTFDTGSGIDGDKLIAFEVNGIHNLVHLLSGAFLLAMAKKRSTAKTAVIAFGVIYALVSVIGLIDGETVLGLLPVNPADNVLHIVLSALALFAGFTSPADDHDVRRTA